MTLKHAERNMIIRKGELRVCTEKFGNDSEVDVERGEIASIRMRV